MQRVLGYLLLALQLFAAKGPLFLVSHKSSTTTVPSYIQAYRNIAAQSAHVDQAGKSTFLDGLGNSCLDFFRPFHT